MAWRSWWTTRSVRCCSPPTSGACSKVLAGGLLASGLSLTMTQTTQRRHSLSRTTGCVILTQVALSLSYLQLIAALLAPYQTQVGMRRDIARTFLRMSQSWSRGIPPLLRSKSVCTCERQHWKAHSSTLPAHPSDLSRFVSAGKRHPLRLDLFRHPNLSRFGFGANAIQGFGGTCEVTTREVRFAQLLIYLLVTSDKLRPRGFLV